MPSSPGERWGQERRWHSWSKALQPRSRRQELGKSPASIGCTVQGAIGSGAAGQENVICWENLGGRCRSLSLARGGVQEHGPARGGMQPPRPCHWRHPALAVTCSGRARLGSGIPWETGKPGFLSSASLGNGKTGISKQPGNAGVSLPAASHHLTQDTHRRHKY